MDTLLRSEEEASECFTIETTGVSKSAATIQAFVIFVPQQEQLQKGVQISYALF